MKALLDPVGADSVGAGMGGADDLASGTWVSRRRGSSESLRLRKCRLEVIAGPDAGLVKMFAAPRIVVGRAGADLVLTDHSVSALHLEIRLEEEGYRLRDLQSTNGTQVWGLRVVEAFIGPGTTIALGESAIRFVPLSDSVELPLWSESHMGSLVGGSPIMRRLYESIDRIAATDATVLITGETGVGKELVAEAIHERSARAGGPFVVLDCGALPAPLFEDQLFGHEAGAFTNADKATTGLFEAAHGGTLLIDEIGELPPDVQPKLLRAVDTRCIRPIGSTRSVDCDVRVIAASNRDLPGEVNRGSFRADLFYRIAVARIDVPPLRQRREDIPLLIEHFHEEMPSARQTPLPDGFVDWALKHPWPGNVRELRNAVERAVSLRQPMLAFENPEATDPCPGLEIDVSVPFKDAKRRLVEAFDRRYVTALLEAHGGNLSAAARAAGLDRMSIYKMLQRLGIPYDRRRI
ncbi:MAG TPA: sigma 54-interacting transcriptional regulator [Polyangia bacterium]|nr:sigma 54-interacting transcriptional regulator [Polyangia bacterium]